MTKIKYLLPIALLASGVANAADHDENPWYVGARIGNSHSTQFTNFPPIEDSDRDQLAGGAFFGYNLDPSFAFEMGYTYLGDFGPVEQQGIDLVPKFTWNATESLDVFGKIGAFYYFTEGQDALSALDDDGVTGTIGLGLEYAFTKSFSARAEYQYYHDIELEELDWNTHFYGVSLIYGWGATQAAPVPVAAPVVAEPVMPEPVAVVEPVVVPEPIVEPEPVVPEMMEIAPLTVELPFSTDSNELPQTYLDQLAPIAQHLIDYPEAKLFVVGHTDSQGSEAYNQTLSEQRAATISTYLTSKFDIDPTRIVEQGQGEIAPIADNDTVEGRALNRRVSVFTPGLTVEKMKQTAFNPLI